LELLKRPFQEQVQVAFSVLRAYGGKLIGLIPTVYHDEARNRRLWSWDVQVGYLGRLAEGLSAGLAIFLSVFSRIIWLKAKPLLAASGELDLSGAIH